MYKDKDKVDSEDYLLGRRIDNSAIADPESTTDSMLHYVLRTYEFTCY